MGGRRGAAAALAVAAGLLALIGLGATVGLGGGASTPRAPEGGDATAPAAPTPRPDELPEARLHPTDRGRQIELLDGLADGAVVRLRPAGFAGDHTGTIRQCVVERELRCHDPFPVRFDQHGEADVQYQVRSGWVDGRDTVGCTPSLRCVLEVSDGESSGYVDTVFGDGAPPQADLRVELQNGGLLRSGRTIPVRIDGHSPAGTRLAVCRDRAVFPSRCTPVGPPIERANGGPPTTLTFELPARLERACLDQPCTLTAVWQGRPLRADLLTIAVEDTAVVHYDPRRLIVGLAVGLALVAAAMVCWRRTDWSPPRSASGSEIDDAVFADLDAEAAAYERGAAGHPIPARTRQ